MSSRLTNGIDFACWAPSDSGAAVPLRVVEMTSSYARWWDGRVQPIIDTLPDERPRADRFWEWPVIFNIVRWIGGPLRQHPTQLTLGVEIAERDEFIPVGMLSVVEYPFVVAPSQTATFVWYMTAAPPEALRELLGRPDHQLPKRLTTLVLDMAVCISFNLRHFGRACLHAAPEGGQDLWEWYVERGMAPLLQTITLPFGFRRLKGNDGRYFYYAEAAALEASKMNDMFRSSQTLVVPAGEEVIVRRE